MNAGACIALIGLLMFLTPIAKLVIFIIGNGGMPQDDKDMQLRVVAWVMTMTLEERLMMQAMAMMGAGLSFVGMLMAAMGHFP